METLVKKERLEYIDAMRGFTMLLVVLGHVVVAPTLPIVKPDTFSMTYLFLLFRMPLFFTISGYFAYKLYDWNWNEYGSALLKKARVQLIPTAFFYGLYILIYIQNTDTFFKSEKDGYWFTIVLFEFFVLYYTLSFIGQKMKMNESVRSVLLVLVGLCLYLFRNYIAIIVGEKVWGLFSLMNFCTFFQFFIYGVLIKKYWTKIEKILDNRYASAVLVLLCLGVYFLSGKVYKFRIGLFFIYEMRYLEGLLLAMLVLQFFRKYANSFTKDTIIGRSLQYIGVRTLDVYLLHFFVKNAVRVKELNDYFIEYPSAVIYPTVMLVIALIIIAFCLIISNIIRTSDFLKYYLFGRK